MTALVFVRYTLGGQENLVGMQTEKPCGLDQVPWRLDNRKMLGLYFVRPICVRSGEGDAMPKAESIPLDYSGLGTLFFCVIL